MGVVYIGVQASTTMETNQALPWLRYIEDREDAREDWEPAEPGVVRPHHGSAHTPSSSPWPDFSSRFTCMCSDLRDAGARI